MAQINDIFGSLVFDERTMKAVLPAKVFASLKKTIDEDTPLDPSVADVVAQAMKECCPTRWEWCRRRWR